MSRFEWQFQSLVAGYNIVPVLAIVVLVGWIAFVAAPVTGLFSLFLGAVAVAFLLAYGVFCMITAVSLWLQKGRARFATILILLLYLGLHYLIASPKAPASQIAEPWLKPDPNFTPPTWFVVFQHVLRLLLLLSGRSLAYLDMAALIHLLVRWKQFSRSVRGATRPSTMSAAQ